jgi:ribose 5-phosphate isomerase A
MAERNASGNHPGKEAAGKAVAGLVKDGMVVGLGTGSTTAFTIRDLDILGVVTSYQSEMLAIEAGIPLTSLAEYPEPDIAIDGADQVSADLDLIKGGGGAQTREKVVAESAKQFVVVIDESKYSEVLDMPVPLEVLPYACRLVRRQVAGLGGEALLRPAARKDGPVISDNGNFILDADFGRIEEPARLSVDLSCCTGVVGHGIFTNADEVYVGDKDGRVRVLGK